MDLDSEIIERLEVVDLTDDAYIPGFLPRVENHFEGEISRMVNSSSGTRNGDVPAPAAFTLVVDNAIRSSSGIAPNQGSSPVRSFDSVVNDAIRSSSGGVAESKKWKVPQNVLDELNLLNQLINALGAVVNPSVLTTQYTPGYILREATSYITEMKSKLETMESDNSNNNNKSSNEALIDLDVDVKTIERDAFIRIQCRNKNHPAMRVMTALMQLDLEVQNASVSVENDFMIQEVKVKMGTSFYTNQQLRSALPSKLSLQIGNINVHLKTRVDWSERKR